MDVNLEVTLEEAVAIVNLLGTLPTSPLWVKLKAQVEPLYSSLEARVAELENK